MEEFPCWLGFLPEKGTGKAQINSNSGLKRLPRKGRGNWVWFPTGRLKPGFWKLVGLKGNRTTIIRAGGFNLGIYRGKGVAKLWEFPWVNSWPKLISPGNQIGSGPQQRLTTFGPSRGRGKLQTFIGRTVGALPLNFSLKRFINYFGFLDVAGWLAFPSGKTQHFFN